MSERRYQRLHGAPTSAFASLLFCCACAHSRSSGAQPPSRARALGGKGCAGVCVVTDVDDTLKSSGGWMLGGIALGGVDRSVSRGSYYPGVVQFQLELSLHGLAPTELPHDLAILTARAIELLAFLEISPDSPICMKFRAAAHSCASPAARGWCVGDVLYGSVQEWICQDRKGWRKIQNFGILAERRRQAGREPASYILCGDNGWSERDEEAVAGISESGQLGAAFIHVVSDDWSAGPPQLPPDRATAQGAPVAYFLTYAGAALKAARLGLLDAAALLRVCAQAELEARADQNFPIGSLNAALLRADLVEARAFASQALASAALQPGAVPELEPRADPDESGTLRGGQDGLGIGVTVTTPAQRAAGGDVVDQTETQGNVKLGS